MLFLTFLVSLVYAETIIDNTQGEFDIGTYFQTFYNTSGFVQLNATDTAGNYTSQIFNAGLNSTWNNISWMSNAIGDLPGNGITETSFGNGNANMTGNVLLLHMNDNVASTTVTDTSGQGNNGTFIDTAGDPNTSDHSVTGKLNTALDFDGTDDYIRISPVQSLNFTNKDFSISLWTKTDIAGYSGLITNSEWVVWPDVSGWAVKKNNDGIIVRSSSCKIYSTYQIYTFIMCILNIVKYILVK